MAIQYCQALFVIQLTLLKTVKQYQMLQRRLEVKYYLIVLNQRDSASESEGKVEVVADSSREERIGNSEWYVTYLDRVQ